MPKPYTEIKNFDRHAPSSLAKLREIMRILRHPQYGCPWDIKQDFTTIIPHTIEEVYELADAIAKGDRDNLREELGDLLLQVVYHAQMADEAGWFTPDDVIDVICQKMINRHPHIFDNGQEHNIETAEQQKVHWETLKAKERAHKRGKDKHTAAPAYLDSVSSALPALLHAHALQKRAAEVGFDWDDAAGALDKLSEEIDELREAIHNLNNANANAVREEMGDALFSIVNVARKLSYNPETLLRAANHKFKSRFARVEATLLEQGKTLQEASREHMENAWKKSKNNKE